MRDCPGANFGGFLSVDSLANHSEECYPSYNQRFRENLSDLAERLQIHGTNNPHHSMLNWTLTFLILALIAGVLGFTSLAGAAASIAQVLFIVFLILLVVSALARALQGKAP